MAGGEVAVGRAPRVGSRGGVAGWFRSMAVALNVSACRSKVVQPGWGLKAGGTSSGSTVKVIVLVTDKWVLLVTVTGTAMVPTWS